MTSPCCATRNYTVGWNNYSSVIPGNVCSSSSPVTALKNYTQKWNYTAVAGKNFTADVALTYRCLPAPPVVVVKNTTNGTYPYENGSWSYNTTTGSTFLSALSFFSIISYWLIIWEWYHNLMISEASLTDNVFDGYQAYYITPLS